MAQKKTQGKKEQKPVGTHYSEKVVEDIKRMSPLALPAYLAECEFYDQAETRKVLDDVIKQFAKDGGKVDAILKPVMCSVFDGVMEALPGGSALRRKGLTSQRFLDECESFSYDEETASIGAIPGVAYVDYKNARGYREGELSWSKLKKNGWNSDDVLDGGFAQHPGRRYKNHRDNYADDKKMKAWGKARAEEAGGKLLHDDYTGRNDIWMHEGNPDRRYRFGDATEARGHVANVDHIVPLERVQQRLAGNYALSRKDIKEIANRDYNFALTNAKLNKSKGRMTNSEYVKKHPELDAATKKLMLQQEAEAERALYGGLFEKGKVNDKVLENLTSSSAHGRLVRKRVAKQALSQAKDYAVGNVVMYLLKPLYWELKDSFINGFSAGVKAGSGAEAIRIRFGRIKHYLAKHAKEFLGDGVWDFVKGFVSSLIESIIGLFVGMFRRVLKIVKEGMRIFVQSAKILWGKNSAKMTAAEKGDAIIKLIGGSAASLIGIGVDALFAGIGLSASWSVPLATLFSGILSALFMYLLDKADLFSVKAERRLARVREVFDARIADLKADTARFNAEVTEQLRKQWLEYSYLNQQVTDALNRHDMKGVDEAMVKTAASLAVPLPYDDVPSFISFVESSKEIMIDEKTTCVDAAG